MLMKRGGEGLNTGGEVKGILHWLEGSLNFLFFSIFEGVVNGIGLRLVLGSARCFIDYFCFWRTGKLLKNLGSFLGSRQLRGIKTQLKFKYSHGYVLLKRLAIWQ